MNHTFVAAQGSNKCRTCGYTAFEHTDMVACDACNNFGIVNIVNKMLLCASCEAKEQLAYSDSTRLIEPYVVENREDTEVLVEVKQPEAVIINALADLPANGNEFYNARTIAIMELEKFINADDAVPQDQKRFKLTEQLMIRMNQLKDNLFKVKELELQIQSERAANQVAINKLADLIRAEERQKLHIEHIDYKPEEPKAPKPVRMSPSDKMAEHMAKLHGITVEHAKKLIAQSIKEAHELSGHKCTCAETPGFCEVHKS